MIKESNNNSSTDRSGEVFDENDIKNRMESLRLGENEEESPFIKQGYHFDLKEATDENNDIDPRAFYRHGVHPSGEQLSFDELGKVYTNISKRRIVSKVRT